MSKQEVEEKRYTLVQDGDCHWYIIPADKKHEFYNVWMYSDEYELGNSPNWARAFGSGPEQVTFTNPEIFGKPFKD